MTRQSSSRAVRWLAMAGCVLGLQGCLLKRAPQGADLQAATLRNLQLPATWSAKDTTSGEVQNDWLSKFADAQLRAAVDEALVHNVDLEQAAARVEIASAYVRVAGGAL